MISAQGDCGKWQRQRLDRITSSPSAPYLPCQHHLSWYSFSNEVNIFLQYLPTNILIFATNLLLLPTYPANTISLNHLSWSATNSFSNEVNIFIQKSLQLCQGHDSYRILQQIYSISWWRSYRSFTDRYCLAGSSNTVLTYIARRVKILSRPTYNDLNSCQMDIVGTIQI